MDLERWLFVGRLEIWRWGRGKRTAAGSENVGASNVSDSCLDLDTLKGE